MSDTIKFEREEWAPEKAIHAVPGDFGFEVIVEDQGYDGQPIEPKLTVALPHQCDAWDVVWEVKTKEEAREALRQLIQEAQLALVAIDAAPMEQEKNA